MYDLGLCWLSWKKFGEGGRLKFNSLIFMNRRGQDGTNIYTIRSTQLEVETLLLNIPKTGMNYPRLSDTIRFRDYLDRCLTLEVLLRLGLV